MMSDLFAVETPLIQRLVTELPGLRVVRGIREAKEIPNQTPLSPAVYVVPQGHDLVVATPDAQAIDQHWLVVTVVRTWRDNQTSAAERTEVGTLLGQICGALMGWQPLPGCGPMTMAQSKPASFCNGYGSFPLLFTTRIILSGS